MRVSKLIKTRTADGQTLNLKSIATATQKALLRALRDYTKGAKGFIMPGLFEPFLFNEIEDQLHAIYNPQYSDESPSKLGAPLSAQTRTQISKFAEDATTALSTALKNWTVKVNGLASGLAAELNRTK